jgi:hypothetical protein
MLTSLSHDLSQPFFEALVASPKESLSRRIAGSENKTRRSLFYPETARD